ncbi:hypothetical protein DL769_010433 [Monosporascus sp. CRB-8-3]|nr:hypothetical protein DL769_010433 [Monosporascus sp. CRB-8-3]
MSDSEDSSSSGPPTEKDECDPSPRKGYLDCEKSSRIRELETQLATVAQERDSCKRGKGRLTTSREADAHRRETHLRLMRNHIELLATLRKELNTATGQKDAGLRERDECRYELANKLYRGDIQDVSEGVSTVRPLMMDHHAAGSDEPVAAYGQETLMFWWPQAPAETKPRTLATLQTVLQDPRRTSSQGPSSGFSMRDNSVSVQITTIID